MFVRKKWNWLAHCRTTIFLKLNVHFCTVLLYSVLFVKDQHCVARLCVASGNAALGLTQYARGNTACVKLGTHLSMWRTEASPICLCMLVYHGTLCYGKQTQLASCAACPDPLTVGH